MTSNDNSVNYLKKVVIDTVVLLKLTCVLLLLDRLAPVFQRGFFCGDESLMLPYKEDTITSDMLHGVGIGLPVLVILLVEWWHFRKDYDEVYLFRVRVPAWIRAAYCTEVAFGIGLCIVEISAIITKKTIGRLRPHFFDVCQPSVDCSAPEWQGRYVDAQDYSCTAGSLHQIADLRKSFLSGHSIWAAYTMIYTILYVERRAIRGSHFARHGLQFVLLMMSWYTALSRVSDFKHHWSDVLAGYTAGTAAAVVMALWCTELVEKRIRPTTNQQLHEITAKQ